MKIGQYTFHCSLTSQALLPHFKGSTLRGALGLALRKIACALRRQECAACLLSTTCAYAFLFEVKKNQPDEPGEQRFANRPHPYLLFCPDETKRHYQTGDSLTFQLTLFGRANDYLPHALYAVKEMGRNGLGKKAEMAGSFAIEEVTLDGTLVFAGDQLNTTCPLPELTLEKASSSGPDGVTITFLTPLRLKQNNTLQDTLPFHLVIRAALRRISSLENEYGNGEPALDFKGLVARAMEVETVRSDCRWVDFERYSNRQRTAMKFGGVRGTVTYAGENLAEFMPLLRYCESTHLGKQTSFGLGKIRVHSGGGG